MMRGSDRMRLLVFFAALHSALGHGRLVDPPSRASMWRYGWNNPHDYNDAQGYCGGFWHQWNVNGGKCGVCGDAKDDPDPKLHEVGGPYANGVVVAHYEHGSEVEVKVDVTANHLGYFQFRVCPYDDPSVEVTQDCLDRHVLEIAEDHQGTDPTKYYISPQVGIYSLKVKLPKGLVCKQCLFQWTYTAGNSWGVCEDGTSGLGCGAQETFRACADVAIFLPEDFESPPCSPLGVAPGPAAAAAIDYVPTDGGNNAFGQRPNRPELKPDDGHHFPGGGVGVGVEEGDGLNSIVQHVNHQQQKPTNHQQQQQQSRPVAISGTIDGRPSPGNDPNSPLPGMRCRDYLPVGPWRKSPGMSKWCRDNCEDGFCPSTHCACLMEPDHSIPPKFLSYLALLRGC